MNANFPCIFHFISLNFSNEFDGNLTGKLSLSTTAEPDNQAVALNIEVRTPSEILLLASGKLYNLMDLDYGISWNAENNIFLEFQSSLNLICDGTVQRELSTLTPRINYDFSLTSDLIHFKFQTDLESTRNSLNSIVYVEGKEVTLNFSNKYFIPQYSQKSVLGFVRVT